MLTSINQKQNKKVSFSNAVPVIINQFRKPNTKCSCFFIHSKKPNKKSFPITKKSTKNIVPVSISTLSSISCSGVTHAEKSVFKLFYKFFNIFRSLITETVTETSDGKVIGSMTSLPTGGNLPVVTLRVDTKYPIRFLVDTGAARSLMRKEYAALFPLDKTETGELVAANNTAIDVLGTTNLNVQIAEKLYPFSFVLADTTSNILGFDFIKRYGVALITDETGFYMKPTKGGLNMHELCANTNSVMLLPTFDHNHEVIYQAVTQPHLKDGIEEIPVERW